MVNQRPGSEPSYSLPADSGVLRIFCSGMAAAEVMASEVSSRLSSSLAHRQESHALHLTGLSSPISETTIRVPSCGKMAPKACTTDPPGFFARVPRAGIRTDIANDCRVTNISDPITPKSPITCSQSLSLCEFTICLHLTMLLQAFRVTLHRPATGMFRAPAVAEILYWISRSRSVKSATKQPATPFSYSISRRRKLHGGNRAGFVEISVLVLFVILQFV